MLILLTICSELYSKEKGDSLSTTSKIKDRGVFGLVEFGFCPNIGFYVQGAIRSSGDDLLYSNLLKISLLMQPSPYYSFGIGTGLNFFKGFEILELSLDNRINLTKKGIIPFINPIHGLGFVPLYRNLIGFTGISVGIKQNISPKTSIYLSAGYKFSMGGNFLTIMEKYRLKESEIFYSNLLFNFGIIF